MRTADIDVEITLFLHISIRFIIFSDGYHSSFLIVFIGSKKPRKPHEQRRKRAIILFACQSFAWFTSSDEVTNRLTATADYGVSVVEDFTPPKDMTPGQEVTKTAAAVNTGNVDAFVRVALQNKLDITTYGKETVAAGSPAAVYYNNDLTKWSEASVTGGIQNDASLTSTNYSYMSYKALITNPTIVSDKWGSANGANLVKLNRTPSVTATNGVLTPDEVTTLQAGGKLVVAASNGVPVPEQFVQSGDYISAAGLTGGEFNDAGEFLPNVTGLYLFRRTVNGTSTNNKIYNSADPTNPSDSTFEYSGYYYVKDTNPGDGTYYALKTKYDATDSKNPKSTVFVDAVITEEPTGGDYVVKSISGLEMKTTETNTAVGTSGATTNMLTYKLGYIGTASDTNGTPATMDATSSTDTTKVAFREETSDTAKQKYIEVTYTKGSNDNVKFYIKLASDWATNWTFVDNTVTDATNVIDFFYLKDDLEAGKTSPKLIESVTLSPFANQNDFVDLTYDLDVILDSIQVTYDGDNKETTTGAQSAWTAANSNLGWGAGKTEATVPDKEITSVSWTKNT